MSKLRNPNVENIVFCIFFSFSLSLNIKLRQTIPVVSYEDFPQIRSLVCLCRLCRRFHDSCYRRQAKKYPILLPSFPFVQNTTPFPTAFHKMRKIQLD